MGTGRDSPTQGVNNSTAEFARGWIGLNLDSMYTIESLLSGLSDA